MPHSSPNAVHTQPTPGSPHISKLLKLSAGVLSTSTNAPRTLLLEQKPWSQWRNHARAITGSARVGFISARAVARPENELGVLCLSITNQDVFRFKTAV